MDPVLFKPEKPGENAVIVEYFPIEEPLLCRNRKDKMLAVISELVPLGNGTFGKRRISATEVSTCVN